MDVLSGFIYTIVTFAILFIVNIVLSKRCRCYEINEFYVVLITGCDSGLGFSFANFAYDLGFTVVAGCLQPLGIGAQKLKDRCGDRIHILELDLLKDRDIFAVASYLKDYLNDEKYHLHAIVNNAGVMVFGEYEWQTTDLILKQININLVGNIKLTKALLPLLRKYKGRVITVTSHCAKASLPGLSVYGATKAGLAAWSDGLRVEQSKYGVKVITFIPGSFVLQSIIMANHKSHVQIMENSMTNDDKAFFGNYFRRYNAYLLSFKPMEGPTLINDVNLLNKFRNALVSINPSSCYEHGPINYTLYHIIFKLFPTPIRDYFIIRFVKMPMWNEYE